MNIINMLKKEVEKGNSIIMKDGTTITEEKFFSNVKKDYLRLAGRGEIDITKCDYQTYANEQFKGVHLTENVLTDLTQLLTNSVIESVDKQDQNL